MRFLLLILTALPVLAADIIPSTNMVVWTNYAGIESWPDRSTISVTRSSGVTISTLNSDIANAASNSVVKLNDGTYTFSTGNLAADSFVTLRGSGTNTILVLANTFNIGTELSRENILVSSGASMGSTSIVLAATPSSATLSVGMTITIAETNDASYVHPWGYEGASGLLCTYCDDPNNGTRVRGEMVRVTAVAGTTVEFYPPLTSAYLYEPRVEIPYGGNILRYFGVEDMTIRLNPSAFGITMRYAQNCWFSNVVFEVRADDNAGIFAQYTHRATVIHSYFKGETANSAHVNMFVHNDGFWFVDNMHSFAYQAFLVVGRSTSGVRAYNYIASTTNGTTALIAEDGYHGAHPQFGLWEGNKGVKNHLDSIHGSFSDTTLLRNHYRAENSDTTYGWGSINVDLWGTDTAIVGNVLGYPGVHNAAPPRRGSAFVYEKDAATGGDEDDPSLLTWNFSGYNPFNTGRVARATAIVTGNVSYASGSSGSVVWDGNGVVTIPNSYLYASKPAFFGSLNWPPIGPDTTGYYTNMIPAEYRYTFNQDPPADSGSGSLTSAARGVVNLRGSAKLKR